MLILSTNAFSKKHHALLGKLLLQKEPETAQRLIAAYFPASGPSETDLSRINYFFHLFCDIQDINPEDYRGALYKTSKVDSRRLFVAVILHFYCPQVFNQPTDSLIVNYGLATTLGQVLKQGKNRVSMMIREVIIWERQYEAFKSDVEEMVNKIKEVVDGGA